MRILGTICARGGSKGVKNKNILHLNGKPLISYTINVIKKWGGANRIIVSTDSKKIANIATEYGAEIPFLRPPELASDKAPKIPVIQHALTFCENEEGKKYDIIIDLDPTSPLRKTTDLKKMVDQFLKSDADVMYSVTVSKKNPYFNMVELDENGYAHLSKSLDHEVFRRQDAPKVYSINGSIYIYRRDYLMRAKGLHDGKARIFIMDDIASVDIDREIDFAYIEFLLATGRFEFE